MGAGGGAGGRCEAPTGKGTVFGAAGEPIRYWVYGDGETTLLLCNALLGSIEAWQGFVEHFARTHRLVLWEYRGHGASGGEAGQPRGDIRSLAEDAYGLLDGLDVERAVLVGNGLGVSVVLEMLRSRPERVQALVGLCGAEEGRFSRFVPHRLEEVVSRGLQGAVLPVGVPVWSFLKAVWEAWRKAQPANRPPAERDDGDTRPPDEAWLERIARTDPAVGLRILTSMLLHHPGRLLPGIRVPVLILGGTEDRLVPRERYAETARSIPGARLVLLSGCSHRAMTEAPERIHRLVEDFLLDQGLTSHT